MRVSVDVRPEKEQWKQVEALAVLFDKRPELKDQGVRLVMMGGARHPADEARVESLKALAKERGVEVSLAHDGIGRNQRRVWC